ncbi:phosphocholine-specific phospholipase C [Raineyella fluvialis]|uniref:phospholipase C n=1 Tax=Raineyella fluvialis TaxID=2662261 RepID=A0A5Q2FBY9_9ACTN|nr:phospholipase C, phosphocholine-specific [Raineyella fluvialis]QGF24570.1 phospholipase C, phosphocholine-specific [Raineyella fluvialis]
MVDLNRRRFLQVAGASVAASALQQSIARAATIAPAHRTGTVKDVEHVVVLMQENRSFDHYLGSLRGVRGFGDPHPAVLPNGKNVWHQADSHHEVLPWHPSAPDLGGAFLSGLDHSWRGGQQAFNDANYDQWIPAKGDLSMAHYERQDLTFHYSLADAFTVCDAYHCGFIGNTDPNRYYLWTGWTGNDGKGGGPVLYNDELGYDWMTYPQRLEKAGVSWKIYQDEGTGLDAAGSWGWTSDPFIGNYGDTSVLYFHDYQNAQPGEPLYEKARRGTKAREGQDYFELLRADVTSGNLPAVSWISAPEAFSEHSNWPSDFGAWYIAKVLDALTSDPEVWSKTVLFITYDENDGFFDHLVPPHANSPRIPGASTVSIENEFYPGKAGDAGYPAGSYGMGPRVPMFVVSPWSTGGFVCSETFDHTSIIRFMESRFGVKEPQITPWRRTVAGDLTSALDFSTTRSMPTLPNTAGMAPKDKQRHASYSPTAPTAASMPKQESGVRPARPLGYDLGMTERSRAGRIAVTFHNDGKLGAQFQARLIQPAGAPHSCTVAAGATLDASWPVSGDYDVQVHGPNGFFRRLAGRGDSTLLADIATAGESHQLQLKLSGRPGQEVVVTDAYGSGERRLNGNGALTLDLRKTSGWYDVTLRASDGSWTRTFAGHIENGAASSSDPQLGR